MTAGSATRTRIEESAKAGKDQSLPPDTDARADMRIRNGMSVDVEDYFQVSAFEKVIGRSEWDSMPMRVERNVDRILELFDSNGAKATFFTLGWICERFPGMVRRIAEAGHEIASHGAVHVRVCDQERTEFRQDVERTRRLLEDTASVPVLGYRAPSFSIGSDTPWAHDELAEAGYRYSSSIFPIRHDHYGLPDAPRFTYRTNASGLVEIPLSTIRLFGRNLPCAGGGYFRLLPLSYSKWSIRRVHDIDRRPVVFYFHPWELDPDQPRVSDVSAKSRFRHYVNLSLFEGRLRSVLEAFWWDRIDRVFLEAD